MFKKKLVKAIRQNKSMFKKYIYQVNKGLTIYQESVGSPTQFKVGHLTAEEMKSVSRFTWFPKNKHQSYYDFDCDDEGQDRVTEELVKSGLLTLIKTTNSVDEM